MKKEFFRKLIHFSSAIYPLLYMFFLTRDQMLLITFTLSVFLLAFDLLRKHFVFVKNISAKIFSPVSREKETEGGVFGSTYFMIGSFLSILLFSKQIAIASLFVLIISDALASLIGKSFQSRKLYNEKSTAGFCAFLISSVIISCFFNPIFIIAAIFVSFIELYAEKFNVDDNLLIPISYGIITEVVLWLIRVNFIAELIIF